MFSDKNRSTLDKWGFFIRDLIRGKIRIFFKQKAQNELIQTNSISLQSFFKTGISTLSCHYNNSGNGTGSTISSSAITITKESFVKTESVEESNMSSVQYSFWNSRTRQITQVKSFEVYKPPTICSGMFSMSARCHVMTYLNIIGWKLFQVIEEHLSVCTCHVDDENAPIKDQLAGLSCDRVADITKLNLDNKDHPWIIPNNIL